MEEWFDWFFDNICYWLGCLLFSLPADFRITVPEGQFHLAATWKDDNLWIENYEPATNTCHFNEYSRGNMLQGKVTIKNCNPLLPGRNVRSTSTEPLQIKTE